MARKTGLFFFLQRKEEKMLLEQEKVVPMALFTPSEGKNKRGKRQNERGKNEDLQGIS